MTYPTMKVSFWQSVVTPKEATRSIYYCRSCTHSDDVLRFHADAETSLRSLSRIRGKSRQCTELSSLLNEKLREHFPGVFDESDSPPGKATGGAGDRTRKRHRAPSDDEQAEDPAPAPAPAPASSAAKRQTGRVKRVESDAPEPEERSEIPGPVKVRCRHTESLHPQSHIS